MFRTLLKSLSTFTVAGSSLWKNNTTHTRKFANQGVNDFFEQAKPAKEGAIARVGRSWRASELRLKSFEDLHKLWYVLLKEKNMLLTERDRIDRGRDNARAYPGISGKIRKVCVSMARLKTVLGERERLATYVEYKKWLTGRQEMNKLKRQDSSNAETTTETAKETLAPNPA